MITVAGLSPSLDVTYLVDSLQLGRIHRPTEVHRVAGGKPLNLARAASTLGASVNTVAILGGATGQAIEDQLRLTDITIRTVTSTAETRTCISIASSDRSDLTEIYEHAPQLPGDVWDRFRTELNAVLLDSPGWMAINGSPPARLAPAALAELTTAAQRAGVRAAVDVGGPALDALLTAGPELVKINRSEAGELLDRPDGQNLSTMARSIADRTGGTVVLTDGADGAVGCGPDTAAFRVRLPADVIGSYPVGSGDSFLGGLLSSLDDGDGITTAVRHAAGCGAANALIPGPGNLDPATAREIAQRTTLHTVEQ